MYECIFFKPSHLFVHQDPEAPPPPPPPLLLPLLLPPLLLELHPEDDEFEDRILLLMTEDHEFVVVEDDDGAGSLHTALSVYHSAGGSDSFPLTTWVNDPPSFSILDTILVSDVFVSCPALVSLDLVVVKLDINSVLPPPMSYD